jgi:hypothetical protein
MTSNFTEFNKNVWKFNRNWTVLRLIGDMRSVYEFWIPILTNAGKRLSIPKLALNWDSERHCWTDDACPYGEAGLEKASLLQQRDHKTAATGQGSRSQKVRPRNQDPAKIL